MVWVESSLICVCATVFLSFGEAEARDYCGKFEGKDFYCNEGQCCGDFDCCKYYKYYKMWWFWLVWALISLLGCCCAYHRKRYFAYHCQIRHFVYPTTRQGAVGNTPPYEQLEDDPKYRLPSYAEVEAMGSLGPPLDGEGAPPPYVDPLASEESDDCVAVSQGDQTLTGNSENVQIFLITQESEVSLSENP